MSSDQRVVPLVEGDRRAFIADRRALGGRGCLVPALRLVVDHAVPGGAILIAERDGVVVLSGLVGTRREREDAGFACWAVPGTVALQNDVVLRVPPSAPRR